MRLNFVKPNFGQHGNISSFEEMVEHSRLVVVALHSKYKHKLAVKPSVFDLVEVGVGEFREADFAFTPNSIPGPVAEHYVEPDKVEIVPRSKVMEHH